jgi:hypothetical protein
MPKDKESDKEILFAPFREGAIFMRVPLDYGLQAHRADGPYPPAGNAVWKAVDL